MSDTNQTEPQGCLAVVVVLLAAILVLLVLMCYKKVELSNPQTTNSTEATEQKEETKPKATKPKENQPEETQSKETKPEATEPVDDKSQGVLAILDALEDMFATPKPTEPEATEPEATEPEPTEPEPTQPPTEAIQEHKYLVVIDPGHQAKGNQEPEPIGPGATETKAKVSSGTQGVATGQEEYELNLLVAEKLQRILEHRGYRVVMIRTHHDVNLSNAERAAMANEQNADVFIRIHANGDSASTTRGIMTVCQTPNNPYNGGLYQQSKALSQAVLEETVAATGGEKKMVWETDTMSGINWCQVPVTIVEMGYLSNPEEDQLLFTEDYQQKVAQGIANGIDRFFSE